MPLSLDAQEIFREARLGRVDEPEFVRAIKIYLRSPEEKAWLNDEDVSIEDMLNGRWEYTESREQRIHAMFERWNALIEHKQFFG